MIILIGGEKGGTGKTTLATNLAVWRAQSGHDVLLVDTDAQGSASYWSAARDEAQHAPRIPCVQKFGKGVTTAVQDLAKRFEDLIIDAGGRDSVELRASLVVCNKVFVPNQASQFDIWTLATMNDVIEKAEALNPRLSSRVIINRASPNPLVTESEQAREILADFPQLGLAKSVIRDRIAYRKAARDGLAVNELTPPDPKAVTEMTTLYQEVFAHGDQ